MPKTKLVTMSEAISQINDGAHVAIGGSQIRRHPMAAIHELIRQNKKNLTLYGWNNANDFDLLIGAGCVKEAHTSRVGLTESGHAVNFRRAVENQAIRFVDHSETAAIERFRAGAAGIEFIPSNNLPSSDLSNNEYTKDIQCPFTNKNYAALKAFTPDVAVIHAHRADRSGNVQLDLRRMTDNDTDMLIAKSAKSLIVTVEQIVSDQAVIEEPFLTVLPAQFVDYVVEAPYGAHPTSCDTRYDYDLDHLLEYADRTKTPELTAQYIREYIGETGSWEGYLEKVGLGRLFTLSAQRGTLTR